MAKRRILVVDDDAEMRRYLRLILAPLTKDVREARTGWEALFLLCYDGPYDLVVSDVRMPWPDGVSMVAMARNAGLFVPALLITAFGDAHVHARVDSLADAVLLDKPFERDHLLAQARGLLAESRS